MKNFILFFIGAILVGFVAFYLVNLFWRGTFVPGAGKTISLEMNDGVLKLTSNYGKFSSSQKVSFIESKIDEGKQEVYVSVYVKYYTFENPLEKGNNVVILGRKGMYKVYYRNPDGTSDFIKEVEYR